MNGIIILLCALNLQSSRARAQTWQCAIRRRVRGAWAQRWDGQGRSPGLCRLWVKRQRLSVWWPDGGTGLIHSRHFVSPHKLNAAGGRQNGGGSRQMVKMMSLGIHTGWTGERCGRVSGSYVTVGMTLMRLFLCINDCDSINSISDLISI